ncbi:MAG: alpha/beta fold hydrolase [Actinophytocola sp.]|nr:alpha/beta fold hydrolase [Actinophytocola sp.]
MATVDYNRGGVTLVGDHWPARGDAEPQGGAVLLHGVGQTRKSWQHTAERLAHHGWSALSLDARGHGDSGWAATDGYTLDHLVDDLTHAARQLHDRPVLIGASMGGLTALVAQAEHRIGRALVLVDIAPHMNTNGAERIVEFMGQHRDGFATLDDAAAALTAYNPHRQRARIEGLRKNLRRHRDGRWYWHWDPQLLHLMADSTALTDIMNRISDATQHVAVPTLLIRGELSDVIDDHSVEHLLEHIPTATSTTVANTGHMVVGDDNDVFTERLLDFLHHLPAQTHPEDPSA